MLFNNIDDFKDPLYHGVPSIMNIQALYKLERAKLRERASSSFCYALLIPTYSKYLQKFAILQQKKKFISYIPF